VSQALRANKVLGRIEYALIKNLEKHGSVDVRWGVYPVALSVDFARKDDPDAYPLTVTLNNESPGRQEVVHAKYVVGSDGAHSWLRKNLNIGFHGDLTDSTWGE
jgi:phenol 2-monooxygenase